MTATAASNSSTSAAAAAAAAAQAARNAAASALNNNTSNTSTGAGNANSAGAEAAKEGETKSFNALRGLNDTFDMFLKLLTTQMKNQDPLKPQDPNEMTNQLVSFANVEQNIGTNQRLDKLLGLQGNGQVGAALGYMGHTVEAAGNKVQLVDGGSATFSYTLPKNAENVRIEMVDSAGQMVRAMTGETGSGSHTVTWDGKNTQNTNADAGEYTVRVIATDANQQAIAVEQRIRGQVTGVDMTGSTPRLNIGSLTIDMDEVDTVH